MAKELEEVEATAVDSSLYCQMMWSERPQAALVQQTHQLNPFVTKEKAALEAI
jgi:hypothetical protein